MAETFIESSQNSCENISTLLKDVNILEETKNEKSNILSTSSFAPKEEFLDFSDILCAPEYVPTAQPLCLARFIDTSSEEVESDLEKDAMDNEVKTNFKDCLQKHKFLEEQKENQTKEPENQEIIVNPLEFAKNIPDFCKLLDLI